MLSLSRIYQLSGRLSRRIHHTTLEVGDFYAVFVKIALSLKIKLHAQIASALHTDNP